MTAFPIRHVTLRTVNPNAAFYQDDEEVVAISLWRMALAASQETLQTGILTRAWLRLFEDQLSGDERFWLTWRSLGHSAEIRRARSALFGRYFARGILG